MEAAGSPETAVLINIAMRVKIVGRDSSVGIVTSNGLDGPRIESRWARDILHPSRLALRPTQPSIQWVSGLPGGKAAGAWC
jgi:hypothetical protein